MTRAHAVSAHPIAFGRSICDDLAAAERREWLVTNGLGGFASGTIAGTLTRRYHGLLIAALHPPVERTLLVTKIDEVARYRDVSYELGANRWKNGYVAPTGFIRIERFFLDGTTPVWHYALGDATLEKRIWMEPGAHTTYVRYRAVRAAAPIGLTLRVFANYRDFHANTHAGDWRMDVTPCPGGLRVDAFQGARPFWIFGDGGDPVLENVWYRDFVLSVETRRGLDDRDDNVAAGSFSATLCTGEAFTLAATCEPSMAQSPPGRFSADEALRRRDAHEGAVLAAWDATPQSTDAPAWMRQCVLAADQFVAKRPIESNPDALTIVAGYPWFDDWGRDTMISLPGLALLTGRAAVARDILRTFASFVDGGMLPNCFPERGQAPEYNTVDAALWYVEAAARLFEIGGDAQTLRALWPALQQIVDCYRAGTRYDIRMDADGLIVADSPGLQLTWMDAKVGDEVITPRRGKPVEIAALWYNALMRMKQFASALGLDTEQYAELARLAHAGFERFWNADAGCCYDVLDGPNGNDATLRPNQLFAISLPHPLLTQERARCVVDACAAQLVTSNGLRTLAPSDPKFVARYEGSPQQRDAAYHQGTVWPWLLGAFATAHARVYGDAATARSFLEPLADQLFDYGLGSISEIADGGAPFTPRGAIAQAWSVGELVRAWHDVAAIAG
ncbi:MAG TPA: amylo-alpha-1,6-glucosidase [Candidatus Baltobacteraceae bacterium]|nr:amylo-alpha-1,6-glucosidase [Candidatus Baltobacteraceae bacterium]